MSEQRYSDNDVSRRDIPSFIEPKPPLILHPLLRPRPQKGIKLFEESELVQVYLRLKPCNVPNNLYEVRSDKSIVTSLDTTTAGHGRRTQHNVSKMYTFSKIFPPECSQKEIFEVVVKDNLKKLPDGHNFTLLTYGPSGSGKTYTLMGTVGSPGLVPRSLEYVFKLVDAAQQPLYKPAENGADKLSCAEQEFELQWVKRLRQTSAPNRDKYRRISVQLQNEFSASSLNLSNRTKYYVWVSFVEIYNEAVYDLLAPPEKRTKLHIREDSSGHFYVKGAAQAFVRSGEEAYDVMGAGKRNLVVAATGVHAQSSRSHCIFTITMLTETDDEIRWSCVRLCDLAGCERARATRNTGARMQESRAINTSLHVLERCLHMLRRNQKQGQESLVPYRESKLTRLLGSGLTGARGEAVSMVVTLNPAPQFAHESKSVLTLAAVAQDIQINNTIPSASSLETLNSTDDTTIETSAEVMRLRTDKERLHFELMRAEALNRELLLTMEDKQRERADLMKELVDEARKNMKEYYEAQLESLRSEMEDMKEEYEERLENARSRTKSIGTPARIPKEVNELITEIIVLKEELAEERLARTRAEKELQHLLTCIEERDEKDFKESSAKSQDVVTISDDDVESDGDTDNSLNESLDPILKITSLMNSSKKLNNSKAKVNRNEGDFNSSDDNEMSPKKSCVNNEKCNKLYDTLKSNGNCELPASCNEDSALIKSLINSKQSLTADNFTQLTFDDEEKLAEVLQNSNTNKSALIKSIMNEHRSTTNNFCDLTFDDEKLTDTVTTTDEVSNSASNKDDSQLIKSICNVRHSTTAANFSKLTFDDCGKLSDTVIIDKGLDNGTKNDSPLINSICGIRQSVTTDNLSKLTFDDVEKLSDNLSTTLHNEKMIKDSNKHDSTLIKSIRDATYNTTIDHFSKLTFDDDKLLTPEFCRKSPNSNIEDIESIKNIEKNNITTNTISKLTSGVDNLINAPSIASSISNLFSYQDGESNNVQTKLSRGTYFVRKSHDSPTKTLNEFSSTSYMREDNLGIGNNIFKSEPKVDITSNESKIEKKTQIVKFMVKNFESKHDNLIRVDLKSNLSSDRFNLKSSLSSDSSLLQFEQLEIATKELESTDKKMGLSEIDTLKKNRKFFDFDNKNLDGPEGNKADKNKFDAENERPSLGPTIPKSDKFKLCAQFNEPEAVKVKFNKGPVISSVIREEIGDSKNLPVVKTYFDLKSDNTITPNNNPQKIINSLDSPNCDIKKLKHLHNLSKDDKIIETKEISKSLKYDETSKVENLTKPKINFKTKHESMDIFEGFSPCPKNKVDIENVAINREANVITDIKKAKTDSFIGELSNNDILPENDTFNLFEDIYNNISSARVTDFELLVTDSSTNENKVNIDQNILNDKENEGKINIQSPKQEIISQSSLKVQQINDNTNLDAFMNKKEENRARKDITRDKFTQINDQINLPLNEQVPMPVEALNDQDETFAEDKRYNLRRRAFAKMKHEPVTTEDDTIVNIGYVSSKKSSKEEDLFQTVAQSEKPRKPNLRLRRRKNQEHEENDVKLKDIVNLQSEFSDVTLDKPARAKEVKDIASPEADDENLPPPLDIQSCPSKSVIRSRRKLFTPRAEALEESLGQSEPSIEQIRVPRPSYHRPKARRKL
ncbi:hypothetical protein K1T71_001073 [Dendrolimus kikuchii]|uniref:Uncharacterized protein n=1 Tax=Dendrolimus kikuchii TaxID=765133 RepID=A0ACC1DI40_9NEOP|nr:hypothetical protein K1T71_001073 [Dendrolimus kikuchii]